MNFRLKKSVLMLASALPFAAANIAVADNFTAGDLLITRSVYAGNSSTVTVGQLLPNGQAAVADGSFPNVFQNETPDPSFGITSPIYLDQITTPGNLVSSTNLTAQAAAQGFDISTSFPSKSEMALNLSTDGSAVTMMGYVSPINQLDVSNSNTPGHVDSSNPVT